MSWARAILSWRALAIALGVLVALLIAVRVLAMTPLAHGMVRGAVEGLEIRGQTIALGEVSGDVLSAMTLTDIRVADGEGVWLEANTLEVRWSPWALVSRKVSVREITLDEARVARRPELAASDDSSDDAGGFLRAITIDDFGAGAIDLAEGVAGPAMVYSLSGMADIVPGGRGQAQLSLTPRNEGGDVVDADLAWGGQVPLMGELSLEGSPDGLIAQLVGAPSGSGVQASLDARRSGGAWKLDGEGQIAGAPWFSLSASTSEETFTAMGEVYLDLSTRTRALAARLGPSVSFSLDAEGGRDAAPVDITVDAANASLRARGQVEFADDRLALRDLVMTLDTAAPAQLTGLNALDFQQVQFTGDLVRDDGTINIDGELTSPSVSFDDVRLQRLTITGPVKYQGAAVHADISFDAGEIAGLGAQVEPFARNGAAGAFNGVIMLETGMVEIDRATLTAGPLRAIAEGRFAASDASELSGTFGARASDDLPASGQARWRLAQNRSGVLSITASGQVADYVLPGALASAFGDTAIFNAELVRAGPGAAFSLESAELRSDGTIVTANGMLNPDDLDLDVRASLPGGTYSGVKTAPVSATAQIAGAPRALLVRVAADSAEVTAAGQTLDVVQLTGDLRLADDIGGAITLDATWREAPLAIKTNAAFSDGRWQLGDLALRYGTEDALLGTARGTLSGVGVDLETVLADLAIDAQLPGGPVIDGALTYQAGALSGAFTASELDIAGLDIARADIDLGGAWPRFEVSADIVGGAVGLAGDDSFALSPDLTVDLEDRSGALAFRGNLADAEAMTAAPITFRYGETVSANGMVTALGGEIDLALEMVDGAPIGDVAWDGIRLSAIGPFIGRPFLRGEMSGTAALVPRGAGVGGEAELQITGLARGAPDAPSANIAARAVLNEADMVVSALASQEDGGLDLRGELGVRVDQVGGVPSLTMDAPASFLLTGGGPIAPLWVLLAPADYRLEGDLRVDLSGSGPLQQLRPVGEVSLQDGVFEDDAYGISLNDTAFYASVERDGVQVENLTASGGVSGSLSGAGRYAYDGSGAVAVTLDQLSALRRQDVRAATSGTVEISRDADGMLVAGDLMVDEARVDLTRLPSGGYTTIEVDFGDDGEADASDAAPPSPVKLDIAVTAPRRIFVSGLGIESEWAIDATLTGTPRAPMLGGEANLVRGEADFVGQRFRLSEGDIIFDGAPEDTRLRVRATRPGDDVAVSILAEGAVTSPEISLSSDPALPQDEILSRVLFGRTPSQLSPLQAAQLASAAASLAGEDSLDLTGNLRDALGVDRLDFGVDQNGAASVSAGQYISRDVYLEVETGVSGAPGLSIEWTPLENVEVDAEVDPESGPKLSVQWTRSFDRFGGEAPAQAPKDE